VDLGLSSDLIAQIERRVPDPISQLMKQIAEDLTSTMDTWCLDHIGHDLSEIVPAGGYVLKEGELLRREITCNTCRVKQPFTLNSPLR
jgi:hypothetical protein